MNAHNASNSGGAIKKLQNQQLYSEDYAIYHYTVISINCSKMAVMILSAQTALLGWGGG